MQISKINNINFKALYIHNSFYDTAAFLSQNQHTKKDYADTYEKLRDASLNKQIELRSLGDGVMVVEVDDRDNIVRYIAKNFENAIEGMKQAVLKLESESKVSITTIKRKRFEGNA